MSKSSPAVHNQESVTSQPSFDPSVCSIDLDSEYDPSDPEDEQVRRSSTRSLQRWTGNLQFQRDKFRSDLLAEQKITSLQKELLEKSDTISKLQAKQMDDFSHEEGDLATAERILRRFVTVLVQPNAASAEAWKSNLSTAENINTLRQAASLLRQARIANGHAGDNIETQEDTSAEQVARLEARLREAERAAAGLKAEAQRLRDAAAQEKLESDSLRRSLTRAEEEVQTLEAELRKLANDAPATPDAAPPAPISPPDTRTVGLGFTFKRDSRTGQWQVNKIKPGGFAEQIGTISTGDVIISVDGQKVTGLSQAELGQLVMGPEGSTAELLLQKATGPPVRIEALRLRSASV